VANDGIEGIKEAESVRHRDVRGEKKGRKKKLICTYGKKDPATVGSKWGTLRSECIGTIRCLKGWEESKGRAMSEMKTGGEANLDLAVGTPCISQENGLLRSPRLKCSWGTKKGLP